MKTLIAVLAMALVASSGMAAQKKETLSLGPTTAAQKKETRGTTGPRGEPFVVVILRALGFASGR